MRIAGSTSVDAVMSCAFEYIESWFAVTVLSAAWFYFPYCQSGPNLCIWKTLLGLPCPGCGLTRGVCYLVHGNWAEAARFNPLSFLAVGILASNILRGLFGCLANPPSKSARERRGQDGRVGSVLGRERSNRAAPEACPNRGERVSVQREGL
jgi:hypothetical protein